MPSKCVHCVGETGARVISHRLVESSIDGGGRGFAYPTPEFSEGNAKIHRLPWITVAFLASMGTVVNGMHYSHHVWRKGFEHFEPGRGQV